MPIVHQKYPQDQGSVSGDANEFASTNDLSPKNVPTGQATEKTLTPCLSL